MPSLAEPELACEGTNPLGDVGTRGPWLGPGRSLGEGDDQAVSATLPVDTARVHCTLRAGVETDGHLVNLWPRSKLLVPSGQK